MKRLVLLLAPLLALSAQAQDYPTRPIRFITAAAPGGTSDILARSFAVYLTESLKQPVVVDNRASASGVIAGELTANAPPDGYTILLAYHQHTVNAALNPKLPYHAVDSFTPITQLTTAGLMLVVNPASPRRTSGSSSSGPRAQRAAHFGSAGIGTGGHRRRALQADDRGESRAHSLQGLRPALMDLIAGQYQFNFAGIQAAQPGARRGCAASRSPRRNGSRRCRMFPPWRSAAGIRGRRLVRDRTGGVTAPIVKRLHDEFVKVLNRPTCTSASSRTARSRRERAPRNSGSSCSPTSPSGRRWSRRAARSWTELQATSPGAGGRLRPLTIAATRFSRWRHDAAATPVTCTAARTSRQSVSAPCRFASHSSPQYLSVV